MDWTVGTFGTVGNDAGDCLRTSWTPMKPAAAKVGGNQGQMVGQRLAVGFLQIVLGVFPTGGGDLPITSLGRGVGVSPTPTRRLIKPSSSSTPTVPTVPGPSPPPHEPCAQRLEAAATLGPP